MKDRVVREVGLERHGLIGVVVIPDLPVMRGRIRRQIRSRQVPGHNCKAGTAPTRLRRRHFG
jgi:hypothetical protein